MRGMGLAAVFTWAVRAGTIASSSGSPSATPAPRRNVRRGNAILMMFMTTILLCLSCSQLPQRDLGCRTHRRRLRGPAHLERRAPNNPQDDVREAIAPGAAPPHDRPHG